MFSFCLYYSCFIEETLSQAPAIRAGAEEIAGISRDRYMKRLTWLKQFSRALTFFHFDDRKKPTFVRITNVLDNLYLDCADGRIRKQPFCILLCGPPGVGKTGAAMRIAAKLMKARYGKFLSSDVVTLNETDEFQSEYRTNHKVVIFDDLGAERSTRADSLNPWRKIIDFVNNIRKTSLNPNLELKGNVYIEPDLVIITTNRTPDLELSTWCICPEAITRRISELLILESYTHCHRAVRQTPILLKKSGGAYTYSSLFSNDRCDTLKTSNTDPLLLDTVLEQTIDLFQQHMATQHTYVTQVNSTFDILPTYHSWLRCFYDDQIRDYLPKKVALSIEVEQKLPWHHRFIRAFCVPMDSAIAQAGENVFHQVLRIGPAGFESRAEYFQYILSQDFDVDAYVRCRTGLNPDLYYAFHQGGLFSPMDARDWEISFPVSFRVRDSFVPLDVIDEYAKRYILDKNLAIAEELSDDEQLPVCEPTAAQKKLRPGFSRYHDHYDFWNTGSCNDPYVAQLLLSLPPGFSLLAEEWGISHEKGDLLLLFQTKQQKFLVAVEVKSSGHSKAIDQVLKYKSKIVEYRERIMDWFPEMEIYKDCPIMCIAATPTRIDLSHPILKTKQIEEWRLNFFLACTHVGNMETDTPESN